MLGSSWNRCTAQVALGRFFQQISFKLQYILLSSIDIHVIKLSVYRLLIDTKMCKRKAAPKDFNQSPLC